MDIPYTLIRSSRKTLSLRITQAGEVELRCPRRFPKREADAFVESKRGWIQKHLARMAEVPAPEKLSQEELRELASRASRALPPLVQQFAAQLDVSYGRITIRSQRTRWGSCSARGNLNFNCLLMLCPEAVREYVVIHELCHRKEMNHSAAFWARVEQLCPDYRTHRKWLKDNGAALIAQLPE